MPHLRLSGGHHRLPDGDFRRLRQRRAPSMATSISSVASQASVRAVSRTAAGAQFIDVSVMSVVPANTFLSNDFLHLLRKFLKRATEDPETVLRGAYRGVRPASREVTAQSQQSSHPGAKRRGYVVVGGSPSTISPSSVPPGEGAVARRWSMVRTRRVRPLTSLAECVHRARHHPFLLSDASERSDDGAARSAALCCRTHAFVPSAAPWMRMDVQCSSMRMAPWTRRSRVASATVGSLSWRCQSATATGNWLAMITASPPHRQGRVANPHERRFHTLA